MKIKNLLTNIWVLSFLPFILVVIIIPVRFNKYILELVRTDIVNSGYHIVYDDVDNDNISERIVAFDESNSSGLSISNRDGIIDQWNLRGSFAGLKNCLFIIGDKDNDAKKEIYVFTIEKDSVFLNCVDDLRKSSLLIRNRFLAVVGKGIKNPDPLIIPAEMEDLDDDGTKELIFGITTGFSKYPRRVYAYYIQKDSLVISPESSYFFMGIKQLDINSDGKNEILPWGYAAGNIKPNEAKIHDCSSFLIALNRNLQFAFEPVRFSGEYSHLYPFIKKAGKDINIGVLYCPNEINASAKAFMIDMTGRIRDSINFGFNFQYIEPTEDKYLFFGNQSDILLYDREYKFIKRVPFSSGKYLSDDIDGDGKDEFIIHNIDKGTLNIFREGLSGPASLKITIAASGWDHLTMRKGYGATPSISLQTGQNHYILEYRKNRNYIFSYIFYPGTYLGFLAFAFLIRNVQRNQVRKRYENEKKISELQLALIRNQLDPHFTLNALNSIIYSVNYGDRNDAADSLRCFAGMYRDMVLSAGASRRTIEEELAFCRNYLTLEKMRFGDRLDYSIETSADLDPGRLIPKFLIQIHCENAIKHGLSPLEKGGMLKVKISSYLNDLIIEITDNGIGREKAGIESYKSTKKGLKLMDELYILYEKLHDEIIESKIIDLFDESGQAAGTKVLITVKAKGKLN